MVWVCGGALKKELSMEFAPSLISLMVSVDVKHHVFSSYWNSHVFCSSSNNVNNNNNRDF